MEMEDKNGGNIARDQDIKLRCSHDRLMAGLAPAETVFHATAVRAHAKVHQCYDSAEPQFREDCNADPSIFGISYDVARSNPRHLKRFGSGSLAGSVAQKKALTTDSWNHPPLLSGYAV
jgi:hypothetical protein